MHNQDFKPHALASSDVLTQMDSERHGLSIQEARARLEKFGPNTLPREKQHGIMHVFFHQFFSPLIYILLAAAVLSLIIQEWSDSGFIFAVLVINAIIGTVQEFSAQRAASALQQLVKTRARVLRQHDSFEIDAEELVPGDIVLLESGDHVPADMRLIISNELHINESLLTGESLPVVKNSDVLLEENAILADRVNMIFAGSLVVRGRATAVVTNTALTTELGHIAKEVLGKPEVKAPLLIRMDKFTQRIAIIVVFIAIVMAIISLSRGMPFDEVFLLVVALAVSAIPEGLPVAITVALAIGMRRMAKRHVIVQQLVAVESLGSCTYIATDKTGTLTVNQLTVKKIALSGGEQLQVSGQGVAPDGQITAQTGSLTNAQLSSLNRLCHAAVLTNDAFLGHRDHSWTSHGDPVDVALLVMAHKAGIIKNDLTQSYPEVETIPFESEQRYSASLNSYNGKLKVYVKGAYENLLSMCSYMVKPGDKDVQIVKEVIIQQAEKLAEEGYRILALAEGEVNEKSDFTARRLSNLTFLGLVALIDPLRKEARAAVDSCRMAGIKVAMITGDHPETAFSIAKELELATDVSQVVNGYELNKRIPQQKQFDELVREARVFARVEPRHKLEIVQSLQRSDHYVAMTGDGANDAPALKAAQVGIAMGKHGTAVARESSDLIITDDNFSSIVAGIEEGRVAYNNVRKVVFLLVSTGAAEIVLFTLSLLSGLPLPLLAVQLLWLNLVTNGIQDVALAFEPAEGDELRKPPRAPGESIFNRIMIERVLLSAMVIGVVAFLLFQYLLQHGHSVEAARNGTLLLMVLFENIHVFNSRSETRSVFTHNPLNNYLLLFGTIAAQLIHVGAMYTPWLKDVLEVEPVSLKFWSDLLLIALSVLVTMELHKLVHKNWTKIFHLKKRETRQ